MSTAAAPKGAPRRHQNGWDFYWCSWYWC